LRTGVRKSVTDNATESGCQKCEVKRCAVRAIANMALKRARIRCVGKIARTRGNTSQARTVRFAAVHAPAMTAGKKKMLNSPTKSLRPIADVARKDVASMDDRVFALIQKALTGLLTSETVAIEVGVAKQRISEWRRDARRYEIVRDLPLDEYQALYRQSVRQGVSLSVLVDTVGEQGYSDFARIEFLKQQGYWADLVGPDDDNDE
jgi:hypothetical protein